MRSFNYPPNLEAMKAAEQQTSIVYAEIARRVKEACSGADSGLTHVCLYLTFPGDVSVKVKVERYGRQPTVVIEVVGFGKKIWQRKDLSVDYDAIVRLVLDQERETRLRNAGKAEARRRADALSAVKIDSMPADASLSIDGDKGVATLTIRTQDPARLRAVLDAIRSNP